MYDVPIYFLLVQYMRLLKTTSIYLILSRFRAEVRSERRKMDFFHIYYRIKDTGPPLPEPR